MKVLHVCLSAFYIEGYAYQENILPRIHKKMGNEVRILASTETYINNTKLGYVEPCKYINADGIEVTRIPYKRGVPKKIAPKLRAYEGVSKYLDNYKPDFIFLHDVQFYNILDVVRYKKCNPQVIVVADGHSDFKNSAKSFVSKELLHGIYYRRLVRKSDKYISKYYGTLPARNDFFEDMYGIQSSKLEYLPMGIDDDKLSAIESGMDKEAVRSNIGIKGEDIVLITGGKINRNKYGIIHLVDAMHFLPKNVRLIVFGSLDDEMKNEYEKVVDKTKVSFVGWLNEADSIKYMLASDIAVFPCLHSTLWEQAAGTGLPCVLYKMEKFMHINVNNNCLFINDTKTETIVKAITKMIENIERFTNDAKEARDYFSYKCIGEKVINDNLL